MLQTILLEGQVPVSHPMWHCGIHSQRLFTLLFDHQVHVVVLQDGDHLYLHGTLLRMRSTAHTGYRKS